MAFYTDPRLEQDEDENLNQQQNPGLNTQTSTIGADSGAPGIQAQGQPKTSGMFVNTRKYLEANKDQADKLGQSITDSYSRSAQDLATQTQAKKSALEGMLGRRNEEVNQARQFGQGMIAGAGTGAQSVQDVDKFRTLVTGNNDLNKLPQINLGDQELQLQRLQDQSKLADSNTAKQQVLQKAFGTGVSPYGKGARTLDQLVLQSNPNVLAKTAGDIQGIASEANRGMNQAKFDNFAQYSGVEGNVGTLMSDLQNPLNQAQQSIKDTAQTASNTFDTKLQGTSEELKKQLSTGKISQNLFDSLSPESQSIIDKLISKGSGSQNITVDSLREMFGTPITEYTKQNYHTPEWYMKQAGVSFDEVPNIMSGISPSLMNSDQNLSINELGRLVNPEIVARQRALEALQGTGSTYLPPEIQYGNTLFNPDDLNLNSIDENLAKRDTYYGDLRNKLAEAYSQNLGDMIYSGYGRHNSWDTAGTPDYATADAMKRNLLAGVDLSNPNEYSSATKLVPHVNDFYRQSLSRLDLLNTLFNDRELAVKKPTTSPFVLK